jgi:hypothetical protein
MKTIKRIAAISLLLVGCMVSYNVGKAEEHSCHKKDYQAACVLSDCCRNMVDNLGVDAEEIYCDYLDNLDCDSLLTVTRGDLETYYWCY